VNSQSPSHSVPMVVPMPKTDITLKTVTKAKADAGPGAPRYDVTDARAAGLVLRVGARGVDWGWRGQSRGRSLRFDLGPVDEWTIAQAREMADDATRMVRSGRGAPDADWLHRWRVKLGKAAQVAMPHLDLRNSLKWTVARTRDDYLAAVKRIRREATHRDYKVVLEIPELRELDRRPIASVSVDELQGIVNAIHKSGRERRAEKCTTVLKLLWKWGAKPVQRNNTGLKPGVLFELEAPERTPRTIGADPAPGTYTPAMLEIGRIVAIARSGAMDPLISCAVELLVMTAQRRHTVVSCGYYDIRPDKEDETIGYWAIPPAHRKTAAKRDDRNNHVVPLATSAWAAVRKAMTIGEEMLLMQERKSEFLFPQIRPKRQGGLLTHINESTLTRALLIMPGVDASPHDIRRAFGTQLQDLREIPRKEVQKVLDHNEGIPSADVTRRYERLDRLNEKWPTIQAWAELVEKHVRKAIDDEPRLQDNVWLRAEIAKLRYN